MDPAALDGPPSAAGGVAPDAAELERRLALLGFDAADAARVRDAAPRLEADLQAIADGLYARAATLDPLARLLDGHLEQCRTKQVAYLRQLLAARPDPVYAAARAWVGQVHRQVGLPVRWYLGALSVLTELFAERLERAWPDDPRRAWGAARSIAKLVAFDAMLAVDAWIDGTTTSRDVERDALREQATPVALEVLPRLLVVPAVGRLDPERARALWGAVLRGVAGDARAVVLDATPLLTLDAEAVVTLVGVARRAAAAGLVAVVGGVPPPLARELLRRGERRDVPLARTLALGIRKARTLLREARGAPPRRGRARRSRRADAAARPPAAQAPADASARPPAAQRSAP